MSQVSKKEKKDKKISKIRVANNKRFQKPVVVYVPPPKEVSMFANRVVSPKRSFRTLPRKRNLLTDPGVPSRVGLISRRWSWILPHRWVVSAVTTARPNFRTRVHSRGAASTQTTHLSFRTFNALYRSSKRVLNMVKYRHVKLLSRPDIIPWKNKSEIPIVEDVSGHRYGRKFNRRKKMSHFERRHRRLTAHKQTILQGVRCGNNLQRQRVNSWGFIVSANSNKSKELRLAFSGSDTSLKPLYPLARVCFVRASRNFWGILHYRNKLVSHFSAGQMEEKGGARRWEDPPAYGVVKALSTGLRFVLQDFQDQYRPQPKKRKKNIIRARERNAKLKGFKSLVKAFRKFQSSSIHVKKKYRRQKRRFQSRSRSRWLKKRKIFKPRFHLVIKLKNYLPYKQHWWSKMIKKLFEKLQFQDRKINISMTLETVIPRSHNGLRPRKMLRQ